MLIYILITLLFIFRRPFCTISRKLWLALQIFVLAGFLIYLLINDQKLFLSVPMFELFLYILLLILSEMFGNIFFYKKASYSNLIENPRKSQFRSHLERLVQDNFYITGMAISFLFLLFIIPFSWPFEQDLVDKNFVLSYYGVLIQTFGAILAIITGFSTIYLRPGDIRIKQFRNKTEFTAMIKSLTTLYILIIIVSLVGLMIGINPALKIQNTITDLFTAISIACFEISVLLITPSFILLYVLIKWILEK